jgi:peptidoglycan/xylan/chitin deacetylase (PgdA/CDA1 family)
MKIIFLIYLSGLFILPIHAYAQPPQIRWPGGAKAAVCLTYDDAMATHLDIAIPELNRYGLKGTFYLQGDNLRIERLDEWKLASMRGHELGNHTAFHPCSGKLDFISQEFAAENYTIERLMRELEVMNILLYSIDGKTDRTYAYTCGQTEFGGVDIIDTLRSSGLFLAARGSGGGVIDDFTSMDLFHVSSGGYEGMSGKEMIDYVKKAEQKGGLAVFTLHGVGGQYLNVSREAHRELLQYLDAHRERYWVATFRQIINHVIRERKRLGWND